MKKPIRQGDVMLVPFEMVPDRFKGEGKPVALVGGRVILAAGEVTGHHHAISDADVTLAITEMDLLFTEVGPEGANLTHEEHGALAVAPGRHAVIGQVEYAPGELRRVAD
jgi:hypothetical protein